MNLFVFIIFVILLFIIFNLKNKENFKNIPNHLNIKYILKRTPNKDILSVTLKKTYKGISLFATKPIKKGQLISYYKLHVEKHNDKKKCIYCFTLYDNNEEEIKGLTGYIDKNSIETPKNNIPFWGHFANEPSLKQKENSEIVTNIKENYKNRNKLKEGDYINYHLIASKNIRKGEEIVWCYGDSYTRKYKTSCENV